MPFKGDDMPFKLEPMCQIWDDKYGDRIEVGPDRDGIDLVEIRSYCSDGKLMATITMQPEQAKLVSEAILKVMSNMY